MPNLKIGILGGSFNPAHLGHIYISQQAIELLGLDEVWWLVSPQNPLKEKQGMAEFKDRLKYARKLTSLQPKIKISDFEINSGTIYTYDTLSALKASYPENKFIWLMGADNLLQFPKWHRWQDIMRLVPIAVFNRGNLKDEALESEAASQFSGSKTEDSKQLIDASLPAWTFLDIKTHPASATIIRQKTQPMSD